MLGEDKINFWKVSILETPFRARPDRNMGENLLIGSGKASKFR
jgi:hypothetical protein